MRVVLARAQQIKAHGGFPFSAAILNGSACPPTIMALGDNNSTYNAIWHAEMVTMTNMSNLHPTTPMTAMAQDLVLVVTAEPCPMCMGAIEWSGIKHVFFGSSIEYLLTHGTDQINISTRTVVAESFFNRTYTIDVVGGILADECNQLYA